VVDCLLEQQRAFHPENSGQGMQGFSGMHKEINKGNADLLKKIEIQYDEKYLFHWIE